MWVIVTLVATGFQVARTSRQHGLRHLLTSSEAAYVRFAYAFPLAALASVVWFVGPGSWPDPPPRFWLIAAGAGVAQIVGTVALLASFRRRDFAVGTVYAKTEVVSVGLASTVLLGEPLSAVAWLGALVCLAGVAWLAGARNALRAGLDPAAGLGVVAGAGFGLAAIGIRAASESLDGAVGERALLTLTAILGAQTVLQGAALWRSSSGSVVRVAKAWRVAWLVAVLSLGGSAAWAVAVSLQNAALVRTLGQVEIVIAFVIGVVVHGERHTRSEHLAAAVVVAGVVAVVLG